MTASPAWQLWRHDEEMAKKSDDISVPGHYPKRRAYWTASRVPRRSWVKRIAVYALIAAALVFFFARRHATVPSPLSTSYTGAWDSYDSHDPIQRAYEERFSSPGAAQPAAGRDSGVPHRADSLPASEAATKVGKVSMDGPKSKKPVGKQTKPVPAGVAMKGGSIKARPKYDGPVHFPALQSTLRATSAAGGASRKNNNVLFAAASLKSASTLLPMACEMAMERQNLVHFAFLGVADVSVEDLLEINGIDKDCRLMTHDARPDHFESSTEPRTRTAVKEALLSINARMHPQAVIVDSTTAEEEYFLGPARDQILSTSAALIELPERPRKSLAWMSKLDARALSAWNKVRVDILIHATPTKTANLKRLLRSIARADLAGIHTPHITVELPHTIEPLMEKFLNGFQWPHPTSRARQQSSMISLRRRITRQPLDEEDSSVRFVESFWPTDPLKSHVLVLSPHTEITPQFFQYVKYSLLHQLHSKVALLEDYDTSLMGLSFSIPRTLADGSTAFSPPTPQGGKKGASGQTAFLWQRPNSEAMLFTGEKWIELHHFISRTLYQKKMTSSSSSPAVLTEGTTGKMYPAWLDYVFQLSRLRGYYTLYPSKATAEAILGAHSDMPDPPEEYEKDAEATAAQKSSVDNPQHDSSTGSFDLASPVDMLETLPEEGYLQLPVEVPLLSWDGTLTTQKSLAGKAQDYAALFRREVGGCSAKEKQSVATRRVDASDLFCRQ
ncbi:hypothetical protein E4U60_000999 [Claviceps pazoutovae]|uniref:Glycosyltransferase 2 n=1 Tax=Claviceps pazoutovae TaxID=1649127 RepID=A0A9P7MCY6_9HYPO|nr:hypothetical protein E4U60_000999 [Claviceps pazoutovae]